MSGEITTEETSVATSTRHTERITGFSDALFGIAITFLALDLGEIPESVVDGEESVSAFLLDHLDDYLAFAGTFVVVGFLWSHHHRLFRYIKGRSASLVWLNLVLLALVALLPYPAGIVGRGFGLGLALVCLLVPLFTIALLLVLICERAFAQRLVIPGTPHTTRVSFRVSLWSTVAVLGFSLLLAVISWKIESSLLCYLAIANAVMIFVLPLLLKRRWPTPDQASFSPANSVELGQQEAKHEAQVLSILGKLRNGSDTVRLCAFTDGVFAIAVTILALQLQPPSRSVPLTNELIIENLNTVPWLTYLTTFAFIGLYWATHVRLFELLEGIDSILIWMNLFFLLFVALLPLPSELVNRVPGDVSAMLVYLSMLLGVSLCLAAIRIYAATTVKLAVSREVPEAIRLSLARSLWICAALMVSIACVAVFDNPVFGELVLIMVLLRGPILRRIFPKGAAGDL